MNDKFKFLVSFDTSVKLKDIGFPQDDKVYNMSYYDENGEYIGGSYPLWKLSKKVNMFFAAPDLYQVQRWYRNYKKISIEPYYAKNGYFCNICSIVSGETIKVIENCDEPWSYETSLEVGIGYAVENL